jgi:hypothetical protein
MSAYLRILLNSYDGISIVSMISVGFFDSSAKTGVMTNAESKIKTRRYFTS